MLEKIFSVQDMLGAAMIVFIVVKLIQRAEKW